MGNFSRAEIEKAVANYTTVAEGCSASGDWRPFADLFTEDVVYIEHHYGVFHGREAVRDWIVAVMAPFPHMRFPSDWTAYDDDNDAEYDPGGGRHDGLPAAARLDGDIGSKAGAA